MKVNLVFKKKTKKKQPFLSTKILAGTYFCKFGENSQTFLTVRYTESWCDITSQIEHVAS